MTPAPDYPPCEACGQHPKVYRRPGLALSVTALPDAEDAEPAFALMAEGREVFMGSRDECRAWAARHAEPLVRMVAVLPDAALSGLARHEAADWTGWRPSYDGEDVDPGRPWRAGE